MSAYLQRLVTAAAGRGDTVQPRTGSIFSAPRSDTPSPLQDWDLRETVTSVDAPPSPRATAPELDTEEPDRPGRIAPAHTPLLPVTVAPAAHVLEQPPPLGEAPPHPAARPAARPAEPRLAATRSRIPAVTDVRLTAPATQGTEEAMPVLVAPDGVLDNAGAPVAGRMPPSRESRAARAERQPEEIQIHIGRIEVTAVPSPPPRAPRPPDRSLSLDDYLRRRGGRAK